MSDTLLLHHPTTCYLIMHNFWKNYSKRQTLLLLRVFSNILFYCIFPGHSLSFVIEKLGGPNSTDFDRSQPRILVWVVTIGTKKRVWLSSPRHCQNRTMSFQSIRKFRFCCRNQQRIERIGTKVLLCHFQNLGHSISHLINAKHWIMCLGYHIRFVPFYR